MKVKDISQDVTDNAKRPTSTTKRIHQQQDLTTEEESQVADEPSRRSKSKKRKKKRKKKKARQSSTVNLQPVDVVKVVHSFAATDESELSIETGNILIIYKKDDSGWWFAKDENGSEGFVPHNYVESVEKNQDKK